jgi:hypothetical protein
MGILSWAVCLLDLPPKPPTLRLVQEKIMKSVGLNFRLFGYIFNFQVNLYRSAHQAPVFHYGSVSNFGKWKVPPAGISNEYKPKKKRR